MSERSGKKSNVEIRACAPSPIASESTLRFHSCRFTKSQKRASLMLSDVSQSFFAALASPKPQASFSTPKPSPLSIAPSSSSTSLLDDEPEASHDGLGAILIPNVVSTSPVPSPAHPSAKFDDDDDWNW